jgi:hypothetical protein
MRGDRLGGAELQQLATQKKASRGRAFFLINQGLSSSQSANIGDIKKSRWRVTSDA